MLLLYLIVATLCMSCFCYEVEEGLITVVAIYRHGDRTPIRTYPSDPYRNASLWPVEFGHLTNIGKMQHFLLGEWLRTRYQHFLPRLYSETQVYIRSTDVDRTLMSAEANLAGLFPPQDTQIWNHDLMWQPIPIHTVPETLDNILAMKTPCDKYTLLLEKLRTSAEFKKIQQKNQQLYEYLSKNTQESINCLEDLLYIYDTLRIETWYNFTLPDWTKAVFPHKMAPWAHLAFAVACYTPELARLKAGPLLNDILNHFLNSTNSNGYKFIGYSAHDVTVANVLNALGLFEYHCPPYGAVILFEFRHISSKYFVNIVYKNSSVPRNLTLRNCSFYCPLDKFIEITKPLRITPEQWKKECELTFFSHYAIEDGVFIVGFVFLALLGVCTIFTVLLKIRKPREQNYVQLPSQDTM